MRQEASRRLDLHSRADLFLGETLVTCNLYLQELVTLPRIDVIGDPHCIWGSRILLHADLGVEVATALHVIQQIASALVQQVIVQCVFFVDGNILLELGAADLKAFSRDIDFGSGLDIEGVIHRVGFRKVGPDRDRDLR